MGTRTIKEYDERRKEIIEVSSRLFAEKGFDSCSINDILREVNIAKGTFYYYFKSKEEVLDAITQEGIQLIMDKAVPLSKDETLTSKKKLLKIVEAMKIDTQMEEDLLNELHTPNNALLHQKLLVTILNEVAPLITEVIEEGIERGEFVCDYPKEYVKILLTAAVMLLDKGIFPLSEKEEEIMNEAIYSLFAKMFFKEGEAL